MKRSDGRGTITPYKDGRLRVRGPLRDDGTRPSLGYAETQEEAEKLLRGAANPKWKRDGVPTFAKVAESVLDEREKNAIRSIKSERYRFSRHLQTAHFANTPVDQITPADISRWLRVMAEKKAKDRRAPRFIARGTIKRALALASVIFDAAGPQERQLISLNPCHKMKVKRRAGAEATRDVEVFLTLDEQRSIRECRSIPDHERWLILFGFGCGVRMGEQHNVELKDVDVVSDEPHVMVRFGSDGQPRKNGLKLRVPLFGFALEAAREQLTLLKGQPNPRGLLFPTLTGCRRKGKPLGNGRFRPSPGGTHILVSGKPRRVKRGTGTHRYVDRFKEVLALAGITRHVRWHDLRHTCASALLQGQWGDAWKIFEVKEQLGHSSITVTERYAHLGETEHKKAAKKVRVDLSPAPRVGHALVTEPSTNGGAGSSIAAITALFDALDLVGRAGHDPATYGLKGPGILELLRLLAG